MSLRVVLFAPTSTSLYSRLLAELVHREKEIELTGIVVRSLWSWKRIRSELRRDGARLVRKVYEKLWLGEEAYPSGERATLRGMAAEAGPLDASLPRLANRLGVPIIRRVDLNEQDVVEFLVGISPDVIVFSGGGLVRRQVLEIPHLGILNCHSGILPVYRGMDVVEWAILEAEQEPEIGLTLHFMDQGVDTGPILLHHHERIQTGDTLARIRRRLEPQMVELMMKGLRGLREGNIIAHAQATEDGRQYFVMHPRLKAVAAAEVIRMAGER
jgi:methionyl-tRNA formyltransferase